MGTNVRVRPPKTLLPKPSDAVICRLRFGAIEAESGD